MIGPLRKSAIRIAWIAALLTLPVIHQNAFGQTMEPLFRLKSYAPDVFTRNAEGGPIEDAPLATLDAWSMTVSPASDEVLLLDPGFQVQGVQIPQGGIRARRTTVVGPDGEFTWFGNLVGTEGFLSVTRSARGTRAAIVIGDRTFEIAPEGSNGFVFRETSRKLRLRDHPSDYDSGGRRDGSRYEYMDPNPGQPPNNDPVEIDVLVVYTRDAFTAMGSTEDKIMTRVKQDLDTGTAAGQNSKTAPRFRLVGLKPVNLAEARTFAANIDRTQDPDDGVIDEVQTMRNEMSADVVILLVNLNNNTCGQADDIYAARKSAFAAVNAGCVGEPRYTISHEIGHLLGGRHNVEEDSSVRPFPEGHGYLSLSGRFSTIMSYNCMKSRCPRVPFWSTSDQSVRHGQHPVGNQSADNASVFRKTAREIAGFCTPGQGCGQAR